MARLARRQRAGGRPGHPVRQAGGRGAAAGHRPRGELGWDAGPAAASWVFDGNTPEEAYRRVLRGIEDGDPAVLDAIEPPAIGPVAGYGQDDLVRDLGIGPGDTALPGAGSPYADAFTGGFLPDTERAAREHAG